MNTFKSLFDFEVVDINGKPFPFSQLRGKKVLIVNTASECGYTSQYAGLEELYQKYKLGGFEIIAFPSNDFGAQEPGDEAEIADFCERNFGVTFPLMKKISVKGDDMHEFYSWATNKALNGKVDLEITWNFQKLLFDENGEFIRSVSPGTEPLSPEIVHWLTQTQLF